MEVLRLVAAGSGNQDIASELSISPKTVSVHVFNILASSASPPHRSRRRRPMYARPRRSVTSAVLSHFLAPAGPANALEYGFRPMWRRAS